LISVKQSWDEMMVGFFNLVYDPATLFSNPRAKLPNKSLHARTLSGIAIA
jgi:hypothetical protein